MKAITPKQLHDWYLEAIEEISDYNKNAEKPYKELSKEQKFIDEYISDKVNIERIYDEWFYPKNTNIAIRIVNDTLEIGEVGYYDDTDYYRE